MIPDYSTYALSDLTIAKNTVNGELYPEIMAAIDAEFLARRKSGVYEEQMAALVEAEFGRIRKRVLFAKKAVPFIAWYLIATGLLMTAWVVATVAGLSGAWRIQALVLGGPYVAALIAAGIALLKEQAWGPLFASGVLGAQAIHFVATPVHIVFNSGIAFLFAIESGFSIGFSLSLGPMVSLTDPSPQPFLRSTGA